MQLIHVSTVYNEDIYSVRIIFTITNTDVPPQLCIHLIYKHDNVAALYMELLSGWYTYCVLLLLYT